MATKSGKKRKRRSYVQEPVKIPADVLLLDAIVRVVAKKAWKAPLPELLPPKRDMGSQIR